MKHIINVSHRHRCVFIHIPKSAGTSIKQVLDLPGGGHPPWHYYRDHFPDVWARYTSFTVIRNPWDRIVSAYCYARKKDSYWHNETVGLHPDYELLKDRSFAECVSILHHDRPRLKHESWHSQLEWLTQIEEGQAQVVANFILRYETLDSDFDRLCRILLIPPCALPKYNQTHRKRNYRSYYDDDTQEMVRAVYRKDIEVFGYAFE